MVMKAKRECQVSKVKNWRKLRNKFRLKKPEFEFKREELKLELLHFEVNVALKLEYQK